MYDGTFKFLELLRDDAYGLHNLMQAADNPHIRRAYVRAEFASIDGEVNILRAWAMGLPDRLLPGEEAVLRQVAYQLQDGGEIRAVPTFQNLDRTIPFVFKVCARVWRTTFVLKRDGDGWRNLKESIALRNRLTHPKRIDDMDVSDNEVQAVQSGANWFRKNTIALAMEMIATAKANADGMLGDLMVDDLTPPTPPEEQD